MKKIFFVTTLFALLTTNILFPEISVRQMVYAGEDVRAYVTNFGGDGVSVIDPIAGTLIAHIKTGKKPHGVAIAPDGMMVYVSNEEDGTLTVIDPATNKVTGNYPIGAMPNQLEVSADGGKVYVTLHGDDALAVFNISERRVEKVIPIGRDPHIALRSPDGKTIFVTSEGDMKIVAVDAQTGDIRSEIPLLAFPRVLTITPDNRTLYQTIRWLNGALVIDLAKNAVVDRIALGEPIYAVEGKDAHGLAVTPDGSHLWLTTQTTNTVTILDTKTHKVTGRIDAGKDPNWIGFTPDGKRAVVSNTASGDVSVIDAADYKVITTIPVGPSPKRLAVGNVILTSQNRFNFDDDTINQLPDGWKAESTNPKGEVAAWMVKKDTAAASKPNHLALIDTKKNSGSAYNICWTDRLQMKNGMIEVKVKAETGKEDQGGGPIWRVQDKDNYYIARWNPLEDNFRLYYVKQGKRVQLDSAETKADPTKWHTIRIEQQDDQIVCYFDGEKLMKVQDTAFSNAGGVGVWTKADAASSFDDLIVDRNEHK